MRVNSGIHRPYFGCHNHTMYSNIRSLDSITTKALLAPRRTSARSSYGSLMTARPVKWTLLSQNPSADSAGTLRTA